MKWFCILKLQRTYFYMTSVPINQIHVIFIEHRRHQLCQHDLKFMYMCVWYAVF